MFPVSYSIKDQLRHDIDAGLIDTVVATAVIVIAGQHPHLGYNGCLREAREALKSKEIGNKPLRAAVRKIRDSG